jgi:hypothetical protein
MGANAGGMSDSHISSQGAINTNGPNATDRDTGLARAEDRANANADLSDTANANSNGSSATDRDTGHDRAQDRRNSKAQTNTSGSASTTERQ